MGAPRKYGPKSLKKALQKYFASISRTITLTERVPTGTKDEWGHEVYKTVDILNDAGEPIKRRVFEIPPSLGGMCDYLEIHRSTWTNYCDATLNPDLEELTRWADEQFLSYLEMELLTRSGKDLKGIIQYLQNRYDYAERREVEMGPGARKAMTVSSIPASERAALLRELMEEFDREDGEADG